jgi:hypothetical protein
LLEEGLLSRKDLEPIPSFPQGLCDFPGAIRYKNSVLEQAYRRFTKESIIEKTYPYKISPNPFAKEGNYLPFAKGGEEGFGFGCPHYYGLICNSHGKGEEAFEAICSESSPWLDDPTHPHPSPLDVLMKTFCLNIDGSRESILPE